MDSSARSLRSIPTGPGSRGGSWDDPEYRRSYAKAWREANPEYRERERLRRARARARARGEDPLAITEPPDSERLLPLAAQFCRCRD